MSKAEYVPWNRKGDSIPPPPPKSMPSPPPPPLPRTRPRKPSTDCDKVTADYRIGDVWVLCWNKTPLDKLVNLAYDDIVRDEQAAASKGKEAKS